MNIQRIRAIMNDLQTKGIVQNPGKAFEVQRNSSTNFSVHYANEEIEVSLKALAQELSCPWPLDETEYFRMGSSLLRCQAQETKDFAVRTLCTQFLLAQHILDH